MRKKTIKIVPKEGKPSITTFVNGEIVIRFSGQPPFEGEKEVFEKYLKKDFKIFKNPEKEVKNG